MMLVVQVPWINHSWTWWCLILCVRDSEILTSLILVVYINIFLKSSNGQNSFTFKVLWSFFCNLICGWVYLTQKPNVVTDVESSEKKASALIELLRKSWSIPVFVVHIVKGLCPWLHAESARLISIQNCHRLWFDREGKPGF